ncbi:hypothetical protein AAG906_039052 [Vitis piasezkii]
MGGFRGLPSPQVRGFGAQDVRLEDRQSYESRNPSVPLPHRPIGDDSITPGPQGGLARGMSSRGPPAMSSGPLGDISPGSGDSRRLTAGLNGYSSVPDRTTYSSREEIMPRYIPERFGGPSAYDQSSTQDRNLQYGNRDVRTPDRGFDRSLATSPPARAHGPAVSQNVPPEKVWPEERLRDMSIAAIKEFYSCMLMSTQWKAEKISKDVSVGLAWLHCVGGDFEVEEIEEMAVELGCRVGSLPTVYLGLPLGAYHKAPSMWDGGGRENEEKISYKVLLVKYGQEGLGWRTNEVRGTFGVGFGRRFKESNWWTKIKFWTDHWCGNAALPQIFPQLFALVWDSSFGQGGWNLSFSRDFNDWELDSIGDLLILLRDCRLSSEEDSVFWKDGGSGIFGVKDAYILLVAPNDFSFPKKSIWVDKVPTKAVFLLGRPLGRRFSPWIGLKTGW